MTTTDAEEVHRLRQRLEKSEATRAKLRASLIALKVCVSEVSPPPPPPPPRARARSPRPDVPASIARAIAHLPVRPSDPHRTLQPSNPKPNRPAHASGLFPSRGSQASVSARAPALEAAGRPAAPDRGKGGIETSEREKNETSAPSAVSVAALLAELSAARADAARYEAEARRASAGSRAEASEERRRRIAAEAAAEEARSTAAAATNALATARAAEKAARDAADAADAASSALERDLRVARAELADARRGARRAETAATKLAARVADLERESPDGAGGDRGRAGKLPRAARGGAPGAARDPPSLESRLASMQSEFEELRARLRAQELGEDEDDEPEAFPTSVRRPLSPLREAYGDAVGASRKRPRGDASLSDATSSDDDETLAAVASRVRGQGVSVALAERVRSKPKPSSDARGAARGARLGGVKSRSGAARPTSSRGKKEVEKRRPQDDARAAEWFVAARESATAFLRDRLDDANRLTRRRVDSVSFPFVEAWQAEGFGAVDAVARALCVAVLDVAAAPEDFRGVGETQDEDADAPNDTTDPGWLALARPWWEGESIANDGNGALVFNAAYPRWVAAVLAADEAAARGGAESPPIAHRVAAHLDSAVAAACAGTDARDALGDASPADGDAGSVPAPTAARLAAAAAACAAALRRARPRAPDGGAPAAALGGAAATRRAALEAFAFGLPAPRAWVGGEAPRGAAAAAAALASVVSAATVWRDALDAGELDIEDGQGGLVLDGQSSLERLEVTFAKSVVRCVAELGDGERPRAAPGAPPAESAETLRLWRRARDAIRASLGTLGDGDDGDRDTDPDARAVFLADAILERWRDDGVGAGAPASASRRRAGDSEIRFAPRARGAEAAAAIADALVWRRDRSRRSVAVQTALGAIEAAKGVLRDARVRAAAGGGEKDSASKKKRAAAAEAETRFLSRASRVAAGIALVGPAFAESRNEPGFSGALGSLVDALASLVALAADDVAATEAEKSESSGVPAAAVGAAAASSLRALSFAGGGAAAEDALGAWAAATDGLRARVDAEASAKQKTKVASPRARRARDPARGGGSNAAEWDGTTVPAGTLVETL